jgi:nicotinamidase-related amidase
VKHTALDALHEGLRVRILTEAVRGSDAEDSKRALAELREPARR